MTRILIGIVGVWFMAAFLGGVADIFHQPSVPPINVGLFLVVPIAGFLIAYAASTRVRRAINGIPLWWITIAHVWRFVGIVFVLGALVFQVLPLQFGIPEGFGDIIAAVFAIPLALALRRNRRPRSTGLHNTLLAWNIFGLLDLISAVSVGILYSVSDFGILRADLSTEILTHFPANLIPTFFVPLFILLHLLGLHRHSELLPDHTDTWLKGGEVRSVKLPSGASMRYVKTGAGQPLVLIHPIRMQLNYFQKLIPLLRSYTVYLCD